MKIIILGMFLVIVMSLGYCLTTHTIEGNTYIKDCPNLELYDKNIAEIKSTITRLEQEINNKKEFYKI